MCISSGRFGHLKLKRKWRRRDGGKGEEGICIFWRNGVFLSPILIFMCLLSRSTSLTIQTPHSQPGRRRRCSRSLRFFFIISLFLVKIRPRHRTNKHHTKPASVDPRLGERDRREREVGVLTVDARRRVHSHTRLRDRYWG